MTREEHIAVHKELHDSLDRLVSDYIRHTENNLSGTSVLDLIAWSAGQARNPTEKG